MKILNGKGTIIPVIAGTGGLSKGGLAVLSSGTAVKATDPVTAATLLGVACDDYDADDIAYVELIEAGSEILAPFTVAGTKKTFADTDIGKVFDLSTEKVIDPDDTTGGCAFLVGYDNDTLEVRFLVPRAFLYL